MNKQFIKFYNWAIRKHTRRIKREELIEVLDRNFKAARIDITVDRYNKILTDLGFFLEIS